MNIHATFQYAMGEGKGGGVKRVILLQQYKTVVSKLCF